MYGLTTKRRGEKPSPPKPPNNLYLKTINFVQSYSFGPKTHVTASDKKVTCSGDF